MKRANKQNRGRAMSPGERSKTSFTRRRRLLMEGLEQRQLLAHGVGIEFLEALESYDYDCGHGHAAEEAGHAHEAGHVHEDGSIHFEDLAHAHDHDHGPSLSWSNGGYGSGGAGDTGFRYTTMARNIGTVTAVQINEQEDNSLPSLAQLLPLGTGPGDSDTIDVSGSLSFSDPNARTFADIDYFAVDLQAGDILDIATQGSVGAVDVFYGANQHWFGAELDASFGGTTYPYASPLQTAGDITAAQVVPETGRYLIQLTPGATEGLYTMGLRVYRPTMEQAPIGQKQILFLDFDGAVYPRAEFNPNDTGVARLSPMSQFIAGWGLLPSDEDRIIDRTMEIVEENFRDIGLIGNNGDYDSTGVAGEFGIELRNSRDHADEFGINPYVSRVIMGGTVDESGVDTIGLAASIDIGNFATGESSFLLMDQIDDFILPIPFTASYSVIDTISTFLANVATHEAGHYFGAWHQDNANGLVSLMDQGGDILGFTNTGPDGIFGTLDDNDTDFTDDFFSPNESIYYGREDTVNAMAFGLATGKVGGTINGTVFSDANRNGVRGAGEGTVAGATVFADLDADGVLDANEPTSVTGADGLYSLSVPAGSILVTIIPPTGFDPTTATTQSVSVQVSGSATADFGLKQTFEDITGTKWSDLNGNGVRDVGEPGIEGVYIYLDLDGDDRLDLGEPNTLTDEDGNYFMTFPGVGTYTIREVVAPGYLQTFPASGEHIVSYDGSTPVTDRDFGNQPVQDYGDAPFPYPTLASGDGAVHGIVAGLHLGNLVDTEGDGQPTAVADGDDNDGQDDEDGVTLLSPLSPGASGAIEVAVTNSTGSAAYLNAWIDLNQDGDWADANEQFITDMVVSGTGTSRIDFVLPSTALLGETFTRFRLSGNPGVAETGFAAGGEVEDHVVMIAETPELANDDQFDVPRGALSFPLDILGNDFDLATDPLSIDFVDTSGTAGQVQISQDRRSVFYTPRSNTLGPDSFTYTVSNASGTQTDSATVDLNVVFQSAVPIAVDDSFNLPQASANQPLNVLANDIPSIAGGVRIIAVSSGDNGGTVSITSGGQSLRYTPAAGFTGTEQFTYTISDSLGQISSAIATIHLQPGAQDDDIAAFIVETFAADGVTPINTIPAGQAFKVRVSVDDLRDLSILNDPGLGSAYLDLLYTDGLVSNLAGVPGSGFDFNVEFGSLFSTLNTGDATIPGLINEIGATQAGLGTPFTGEVELFTITMLAVNPGIAEFVADPADSLFSDVVLLNPTNTELVPEDIFFGRRQLTIVPSGSDFTFAVDDSYPDQIDSAGNPIVAGSGAVLDVLANDNLGPTGEVEIVNIGAAANGTPILHDNGTPFDSTDDYIVYTPISGFVGVDQFTYTILSADGIQSTAQVTVTVGDAAADDLVDFDVMILDENGDEVSELAVGQQFTIQIMVDDLRPPMFGEARGVFAAYMDLLYNSTLAEPVDSNGSRFGFDVLFGDKFDPDTAVGDAFVPGLINEFGTFQTTAQGSGDPLQSDPVLLAQISMIAKAPGDLRVIADPADVSPFQDTLLFQPPDVVPISRINYDVASVQITGGGEGESPYQNGRNRWDVNDDNSVSPIDALLVINRLNRGGEGEDGGSGGGNGVYWDVNGDSRISPIDALQVINYLNRGGSGEGEAPTVGGPIAGFAADSLSAEGESFTAAVDSIFESFGSDEGKVADSGSSSPQVHDGYCAPLSIQLGDDDDDEDKDDSLNGELA